jgi:hypothetical protein
MVAYLVWAFALELSEADAPYPLVLSHFSLSLSGARGGI